jgi:hypothetical protein
VDVEETLAKVKEFLPPVPAIQRTANQALPGADRCQDVARPRCLTAPGRGWELRNRRRSSALIATLWGNSVSSQQLTRLAG